VCFQKVNKKQEMLWPFATKLQSNGSKVLCSSLIDNFADLAATCVEDVIKTLFQQLCCLLHSSVDDAYTFLYNGKHCASQTILAM